MQIKINKLLDYILKKLFTYQINFVKNNAYQITLRRNIMKKLPQFIFSTLFIVNVAVFSTASFATPETSQQIAQEDCHSFVWNLDAAKNGDATAQYQLGMMYFNGDQVTVDTKLAKQWLEASAEQNNVKAQNRLAMIADLGLKTKPNPEEAFHWYSKAADQGDIKAQYKVADAYKTGTGVKKDSVLAQQWLNKATETAHVLAQNSAQGL